VNAEYLLDPLYPWTWWRTTRLITRRQPDLVVIQWWTTFWAPAFSWLASVLRRKGVRVVFIIHNVIPHEPHFFDRALARTALGQGFAFVAQTNREKKRLLELLPGRRVDICTLPVYSMLANKCIPTKEARRILGISEQTPVLLFFGIVRPYKGLKFLIEALAQLGDLDQNPVLIVAGEIWENKDEYQEMVRRLGLEARVRLEDRYVPDEEAALMFSAADTLVAPYVGGTQSAAVGMALGCGLPMVISEVIAEGIAPEYLKDNVQVFPPGDVRALVEAIRLRLRQRDEERNLEQAKDDWWRMVRTLEVLVESG